MNVHESEKIAGILSELGYEATEADEKADVIVFNTCCIRDTAEQRAIGNIGKIKPLKKIKKNLIAAVVGCMTEQHGKTKFFREKYPFVDIVLGTSNIGDLKDAILQKQNENANVYRVLHNDTPTIDENQPVLRSSGTNAWVNIMYGCNNFCSYCIVPYVRGRERSRKPQAILDEVKGLLDEGYQEITLLGQNVDSYMRAENSDYNFARLLREIGKLDYKFRLRFMTSHPKDFNEEVVDAIASSKNICNNVHLPVQSGSSRILEKMNRHYTAEHYLNLIKMTKNALPDVGITTDIMVGFPTETEEDFQETLGLVKEARFSNAFTFIYSVRKGTKAAEMQQIPYDIKRRRISELIKLQNQITKEESNTYFGKSYEILVEDTNGDGKVCGRTESGRLVTAHGNRSLIGTFKTVKITKAQTASLFGEFEDEKTNCEK